MKLKFQLMKNFNIILIACLAFIFLISSGCSKEEDSPYTREQIIGKWYIKSYYIEDKYGNGKWEDEHYFGKYYDQYNADGTYYIDNISSPKSSWSLNGKTLTLRLYEGDGQFYNRHYEVEELTGRTLIVNTKKKYPNNSKIKYINEKYINERN